MKALDRPPRNSPPNDFTRPVGTSYSLELPTCQELPSSDQNLVFPTQNNVKGLKVARSMAILWRSPWTIEVHSMPPQSQFHPGTFDRKVYENIKYEHRPAKNHETALSVSSENVLIGKLLFNSSLRTGEHPTFRTHRHFEKVQWNFEEQFILAFSMSSKK